MSTGAELVPAEVDAKAIEVERQVAEARAQAEAIEVHDDESAALATGITREIQRRRKAAKAELKELVDPLNATVKKIRKRFTDAMAPFEEADDVVRGKLQTYTDEKERVREEEERRLEAERQERERKIREERERQEAEAKAKAEQAAKETREAEEEAARAKSEEDRAAAEALAEEARIAQQEAATAESAIASLPEVELPAAVVPAAAKPEGLSTTKRWDFEVIDFAAIPDTLPDGTPIKELLTGPVRRYMHAYIKEHGHPPEMAGLKFEQVSGLSVKA